MIMPDSNTPLWQNSQQKQKPTTRPGYQIQPPRISKPNAMLLVDEIKADPCTRAMVYTYLDSQSEDHICTPWC